MMIQLLGAVRVTDDDGRTVDIGPARCQTVLTALALDPGRPVTVDRLIRVLWADSPPRTADKTLQSYVSVLRRALEPIGVTIRRTGVAYVVDAARAAVDVCRFEDSLDAGDVEAALAAWGGTPLAGLHAPGLDAVVDGLVGRWLGAVEQHLGTAIDEGATDEIVARLGELTTEHPYHEGLWALLMRALYQLGRQADALAAYGRARHRLVDGLGIEPGPQLQELEAAILRQDPALAPTDPAPSAATATAAAASPPSDERQTVALLTTDIEGSTSRWERFADVMMESLARHDELLLAIMEQRNGSLVAHTGDGIIAAFTDPIDAVAASDEMQQAMARADWSSVDGLRIRVAVHRGEVVERHGDLFGWAINFASRLNSLGHGGQILLSQDALDAVVEHLPAGLGIVSLGRYGLRDIAAPTEVFQLTGPALDPHFPPLRSSQRVHTVAAPATPLIGRDDDLQVLEAALGAGRLISIVGPPGVGTSRLAAALAVEDGVTARFEHGVTRLDLADVAADALIETATTTLGVTVRSDRGAEASLVDWLTGQNLLLLVEHGERSIEILRPLIEAVLRQAPRISIVATGSRPLGLAGEVLHRLGPLAPADAMALFRDRAAAAGAQAHDTKRFPDQAVATLCERLEYLPLSIQATAASAVVHSVAELQELVAEPARAAASPGLGPMVEAVNVSIEALPADLRAMLVAATAFTGRFDRAAFAAVCAPDLDERAVAEAVAELVNRSLLQMDEGADRPRFRLLTVVADGARRLATDGELTSADDRLRGYVIDFVGQAAAELRGPGEFDAHRRLQYQFDNVRTVFEQALAGRDLSTAAAIGTTLWDYAFMRFNDEYFRWSARILTTFEGGDEGLLAPVFGVAALGAWFHDDIDATLRWAERALEAERQLDLDFDLPARLALNNAAVYSGAAAPAAEVYREQERYQRDRPERYFHVNVETQNCVMATWLGATELAVRRGVEAVRLAQESENPSSIAFALWGLATALGADDPIQAESLLARALEQAREVGNRWLTALTQLSLAALRRRTGSSIDAAPLLIELLDLLTRAGHQSHLWATLRLCGLVLGDLGNDSLAVQLRRWVDDAKLAMPALPADQAELDAQYQRITDQRGEAWIERNLLLATAWTLDSAVELVRDELSRHLAATS